MQTLRMGSAGPQVELLQLALFRLGLLAATDIDGLFGRRTRDALLRFQTGAGLAADGVAGPKTWAALAPQLTGFVRRTVRRGDTLYRLAARYGTGLAAIEAANPGLDPLQLRPGTQLTVPLGFEVVPVNVRFTSTLLSYCVQGLAARYPFLRTERIGTSVLGRPLYALGLGSGQREVFYNAAHHANEWITSPLLMKFLETYARACAFGGRIAGQDASALFRRTTLWLAPMVNPDGVDLVTGELAPGSTGYARALALSANYPAIAFPSGWKANADGVDPNLQYPAGWERAREIKFTQGFTRPGPRDYVGTAPLTAPESRALYTFTRAHDFSLTLSYHTQGNVIYWKYADFEPENSYAIGRRFAELSGYRLELTPPASSWAGYKDWFIAAYDRPGYTIEVGRGAAPLPLEDFADIYAANEGILTEALAL